MIASLCTLVLVTAPAKPVLALGDIHERGKRVQGQADLIRDALAAPISQSGAFAVLASKEAQAEVDRIIVQTNRAATDDTQWVALGKKVGATHVLTGVLREVKRSCTVSMRIVNLTTRDQVQSNVRYYDCSEYKLTQLASRIAAELTGADIPIEIVLDERAEPAEARVPDAEGRWPPVDADARGPVGRLRDEFVPPADEFVPPADEFVPPAAEDDVFTIQDTGALLIEYRDPIAAGLLAVPLLFVLLGGIAHKVDSIKAQRVMRRGMVLSLLFALMHAGALFIYRSWYSGDILKDLDVITLVTPYVAFLGSIVGARIVGRE